MSGGTFRDQWVEERLLFMFMTQGGCQCCGFALTTTPSEFMRLCSDAESDDIRSIEDCPWPTFIRELIWRDRLMFRQHLKELQRRVGRFWLRYAPEFCAYWAKLSRAQKVKCCTLSLTDLHESLLKLRFEQPYAMLALTLVDQIRRFHLTSYPADACTLAELEFEHALRDSAQLRAEAKSVKSFGDDGDHHGPHCTHHTHVDDQRHQLLNPRTGQLAPPLSSITSVYDSCFESSVHFLGLSVGYLEYKPLCERDELRALIMDGKEEDTSLKVASPFDTNDGLLPPGMEEQSFFGSPERHSQSFDWFLCRMFEFAFGKVLPKRELQSPFCYHHFTVHRPIMINPARVPTPKTASKTMSPRELSQLLKGEGSNAGQGGYTGGGGGGGGGGLFTFFQNSTQNGSGSGNGDNNNDFMMNFCPSLLPKEARDLLQKCKDASHDLADDDSRDVSVTTQAVEFSRTLSVCTEGDIEESHTEPLSAKLLRSKTVTGMRVHESPDDKPRVTVEVKDDSADLDYTHPLYMWGHASRHDGDSDSDNEGVVIERCTSAREVSFSLRTASKESKSAVDSQSDEAHTGQTAHHNDNDGQQYADVDDDIVESESEEFVDTDTEGPAQNTGTLSSNTTDNNDGTSFDGKTGRGSGQDGDMLHYRVGEWQFTVPKDKIDRWGRSHRDRRFVKDRRLIRSYIFAVMCLSRVIPSFLETLESDLEPTDTPTDKPTDKSTDKPTDTPTDTPTDKPAL